MAVPLAGDTITASDINDVTVKYITKSANESVTSSATPQDDNDFVVALPVGVWRIEIIISYTCATTGDIMTKWTTTGTITSLGRWVLGGGTSMTVVTDETMRMQGASIGTGLIFNGNGTNSNIVREEVLVDVSVAGNLQFQWSQGTSDVTATTVTTASRMFVTKVETY